MSFGDLNEFLEELGLTEYEAKVMTTLFKLKEAEAPLISRNSQVPKTRVYDVLEKLTKKGLIIEVSGRPKKYKCFETQKVFDSMLDELRFKIKKLEEKATVLKNFFSKKSAVQETEKVLKVKDKNDFARIIIQEIETAKNSINAFSENILDNSFLVDALNKTKNRNIEIKIIASLNEKQKEKLQELESKGIKIKKANHDLDAFIVDGKKVILSISKLGIEQKQGYHFTIWPENPHMATALQQYFDKIWNDNSGSTP